PEEVALVVRDERRPHFNAELRLDERLDVLGFGFATALPQSTAHGVHLGDSRVPRSRLLTLGSRIKLGLESRDAVRTHVDPELRFDPLSNLRRVLRSGIKVLSKLL